MLEIIPELLICLLAVYGALSLIISVISAIFKRIKSHNAMIKLALIVKNQEQVIEGVVRNVVTGDYLKKAISEGKIYVVDMDSKDDTWRILNKLKDEYEQVEVLHKEEKAKIFEGFEENT